MGAWFGDNGQAFLVAGCAPSVPTTSLTLGAFACSGYVLSSTGSWTYITQAASVVGPLNAGNGTYWVALHADLSTAVGGWTRQTGTHYLWQKSATLPSTPVRTIIVSKITVAGGIITATAPVTTKDPARYPRGVSLTSFPGVDSTGATDSSPAIQVAVNSTSQLWVPNGTYLLGSSIVVPSNLHMECESPEAIFKMKDSASVDMFYNDYAQAAINDVVIRGCTFNGNKANNTSGSAVKINGTNLLVESCYFHDTPNAAIDMGRPAGADFMRMVNNVCVNPSTNGTFWGCYAFTGGANLLARGNIATSTDGFMNYCFDVEPNAGWAVGTVLFQDNMCTGGTMVATAGAGTINHVLFQNNFVDETGASGGPAGMRVSGVGSDIIVSGNDINTNNTTLAGLEIVNATRPVITNNKIVFRGGAGTITRMGGITLDTVTDAVVANNTLSASLSANVNPCLKEINSGGTFYGINVTNNCTPYGPTSETRTFAVAGVRSRLVNFRTVPLNDLVGAGSAQNLITNSQVFSGGWFANSTMVAVDNNQTDPLGQANLAATATAGAGGNPYLSRGVTQTTAVGEYWVASVWIRANAGAQTTRLRLAGDVTGTMGDMTLSVGTGWNRFYVSGQARAIDATLTVLINEGGTGNVLYLWGAQLERGQSPGPYLRTYGTATTLESALSVNNMLVMGNTIAADLPTVMNGALMYCSDCAVTGVGDNTCAGGGTGALAFRINAVWRCFNAQN